MRMNSLQKFLFSFNVENYNFSNLLLYQIYGQSQKGFASICLCVRLFGIAVDLLNLFLQLLQNIFSRGLFKAIPHGHRVRNSRGQKNGRVHHLLARGDFHKFLLHLSIGHNHCKSVHSFPTSMKAGNILKKEVTNLFDRGLPRLAAERSISTPNSLTKAPLKSATKVTSPSLASTDSAQAFITKGSFTALRRAKRVSAQSCGKY